METLWQDVRHAARLMVKNPGFTVAAVVCLMLGIGATTAIFSVVNSVLLRPLPYKQPQQLVRIYTEFPTFPNGGLRKFWTSPPEFLDLRRDLKSWSSLEAWVNGGVNIAGLSQPARVTASYVSGGMMDSLGVSPLQGRLISPKDDDPAAPLVADISYSLWKGVFAGDANVVGRETLLDGQKCTIVGVMPRSFDFPPGEVDAPLVWTPLQLDPAKPGGRGSHYLYLLGRLKPGATPVQAQSEIDAYVHASGEAHPATSGHFFNPQTHTLVSFPLQAEVTGSVRPALVMLLAAVGFVLLIACTNVANLLLARAEARRREIAVRSALGAGLGRLARQFVTEGILLSSCGAILGLLLAFGGLRLIQFTNAGSLPRAAELSIDLRVLLFTVAATIVTGVLFGLAPLVPVAVANLHESLKDTAGSSTGTAGAEFFRRLLVAAELSLALILLVGCGLMVKAFWRLQEVHTGMNPANVLTMSASLPPSTYSKDNRDQIFWSNLAGQLSRIPGVQSAAIASGLPPLRPPNMNDTKIEGWVMTKGGPIQNVDYYQIVTTDFFKTLGIRLIEGRLFNDGDGKGSPDVIIVNQTLARTFWPHQSAIGKHIQPGFSGPECTIIGVVEDVKNAGLDKPAGTELFLPVAQANGSGVQSAYLLLRAEGNAASITRAVRSDVRDLDPTIPIAKVRTMDDVLSAAQSRPRFFTLLLSLFSGVALVIAAVGIYGVIAYNVARRSKEFGLRMALGAQSSDVLGLVLRQGAILTAIGVAVGAAAALALTRLMSSLLYDVSSTDIATYVTVSAILAAVALFATYVPARRATRVDPMKALRYE
ncbi:MAG TPA: ABC transporter permease [Candidatus Acidoferrales bacterium]|nr:ABC transporter permease [Candidatus Acidoferrales bacterium]